MARIYYLLTFLITTILLFHFAGLISGTPSSQILNWMSVTEPQNFETSGFYIALLAIFTGIAIGGIAIGTLTKDANTLTLVASAFLAMGMLLIAGDISMIFVKLIELNKTIATIIFAPLTIAWLIIIYDWWRGVN